MDALHKHVVDTIRRHGMIAAGDRVGVAVSGGADSVALLLLLDELRGELGITLLVLHFHHQLRGAEADADQQFSAALAHSRDLEFLADTSDVAAEAHRQGWNLEDAGRRLRYEFFESVVSSGRATRVAVAHTMDDQAETVLAHILRGTGLTGLAGIYPVAGHVVRPVLETRRAALRYFLTARRQTWREDQTNRDLTRLRARIRHTLLPQLETDFQPASTEHLASLADRARQDEVFWRTLLEDRYRALVTETPEALSVAISDLFAPLALRSKTSPGEEAPGLESLSRRLVRRIVSGLRGGRQLTSGHVEQVLRLARECSSGARVSLPGGAVVQRIFDRLVFSPAPAGSKETIGAAQAYEYAVDVPQKGATVVEVREIGKRFCLKVIDWPPTASETRDVAEALDRDRLGAPLVLRNWRPGDAYRPRGRQDVHKLKRLFLDRRVAATERPGWPVLTSAGHVVWARGFPPAAEFAVGAQTRAGLLIVEEPIEGR